MKLSQRMTMAVIVLLLFFLVSTINCNATNESSKTESKNSSTPSLFQYSLLPSKLNVSVDASLNPVLRIIAITFVTLSAALHLILIAKVISLSIRMQRMENIKTLIEFKEF